MSLLTKLNELMEEKGINKAQLSRDTGIPYTTISSLYHKGYENIRLSTLQKLADYFDCSLDYLVDNEVQANWSFNDATKYLESHADTIAAHFDGEEFTEEQLEKIKAFAAFIKSEDKYTD